MKIKAMQERKGLVNSPLELQQLPSDIRVTQRTKLSLQVIRVTCAAVAPPAHSLLERIRLFHFIFPASVSSLLFF
jgi:hypothetical protein